MGELIDLQAYREQKQAEEIDDLRQQLDQLRVSVDPQPFWPGEEYYHLSPQYCSFTDELIEYYYQHDSTFFAESLLAFINDGETDEELGVEQRPEGEIEPDRT